MGTSHTSLSEEGGDGRLVETERYLPALHQNGPLDQVRMLGHEAQGFGARRRILLHTARAVELIPGIEEEPVIPLADEPVQLGGGKAAAEIDLLEGGVFFAKQTLRFAARCSSGFQVELQHETMVAGRRRRLDAERLP